MGLSYFKDFREDRVPSKELHIIAWWVEYAEQTAERLPDTKFLITPCRSKSDVWYEYKSDLFESGLLPKQISTVRSRGPSNSLEPRPTFALLDTSRMLLRS